LLAVNLLLPVTAAAQTPPGAVATPRATPGAAALTTPLAAPASPAAGATPAGPETPGAGTPGAGGTEAPGTATPRPVIVPDCGPGMAGMIAPSGAPPAVAARTTQTRPTAAPTRLPFPTSTPDPNATVSPVPTRAPSFAVVQELRGLTQDLANELLRIDQELTAAAASLRQAEADLDRLSGEIVVLEAELVQRQAAMDERSAVYGTRLRALYKFTRVSPLEEILSARDFGDLLNRLTMLQAVTRVDNRLLGQLKAERDAVQTARDGLREREQAVTALRAEIVEQQRILTTRRDEQAVAVARAQEQQARAEAALASQQATALGGRILSLQQFYGRQLDDLERQRPTPDPAARATAAPPRATPTPGAAAATPTPPPAGTPDANAPSPTTTPEPLVLPSAFRPLTWPVADAVVTTEFGEPNFAQAFHTGIDLAQRLYAPIVAAEDGIVIACGYAVPGERTLSYGLFLVLAHDRAIATLYGHMDDEVAPPPVKVGDVVKRGQVVGFVGLTGLTTGPHLHFEVRAGGQIYNPWEFMVR
jgi:murein DD-endopeptidase MepM/ murein hydrolase activator NlpD